MRRNCSEVFQTRPWPVVFTVLTAIIVGFFNPAATAAAPGDSLVPYRHGGSVKDFFPGVGYDPAVPSPDGFLGFPLGSRPVHYDEAIRYLKVLADASPRAELHAFGHTHEARTLYYLMVGSETHVAEAEAIRRGIRRLAQPPADGIVPGADGIIDKSPVIAWMGYSIHGDELSGVDAALQTAYRLVAGTDSIARTIRDSVLVLIDPMQNPDGRERYLAQVFAYAGVVGNTDDQSLQHQGFWPWGRANHYLFDMNRDWMCLVHPESRARVSAFLSWNPQLAVDAHEMGPQSSFLFSPPREPVNPNVTPQLHRWWRIFAADDGAEFDRRGWSYYTGDWNEEWFPGYGSSWSLFTGAVGILYEQARVAGSGVKRGDGTVLTYAETVAHQTVSSLANLTTAARNRHALLADFAQFRSDAVTGRERRLRGAYILAPGDNPGREHEFLRVIMEQGIQVEKTTARFSASVRAPGGETSKRTFPTGTYLIPLNQPLGLLARAILEFDPHLSPDFLQEERRELEKGDGTRLYEVSGWSLAEAYDLDITYTARRPSPAADRLTDIPSLLAGTVDRPAARYGVLIPITDDRSMNALTQILQAGLNVRSSRKPFVHGGTSYGAGTLLLRRSENPPDLNDQLSRIAGETGVRMLGVSSGYSSDGPDLGSDLFTLLRPPRVGLFMGSGIDFTSCGFIWFLLDHEMRMKQSLLDIGELSSYDLSAYNVLVLPSYWGGTGGLKSRVGTAGIERLKSWVKAGGTLIAVGDAAYFCADSTTGLSDAREKSDILDRLDDYDQAYVEEQAARRATVDTNAVWRGSPTGKTKKPKKETSPDLDALRRIDEKARLFHPRGVIMRLALDPEHWLNFGAGKKVSAMVTSWQALVAMDPVEVPARIETAAKMRLSGLLWPEARQRWEKTAFATRDRLGHGQVILFAGEPFFRGYFHGTKRLFLNAVLLGPGMGTRKPPPW